MPERSRNQDGRFRKKRSDTELKTLKQIYDGSVPNGSPKKELGTILKQTGEPSLSKLIKDK